MKKFALALLAFVCAESAFAQDLRLPATDAVAAFKEMVLHKRNPAMDEFAILDNLRKIGLIETANYLHALL